MLVAPIIVGVQVTSAKAASGVIRLHVYALAEGGKTGHAWLVVENGTSSSYSFYNTTISAGETVSIGTWGNVEDPDTGKRFYGAWLNIEAYLDLCANNTYSISMVITQEQLTAVSEKCIDLNKWNYKKNCLYFASTVWNTVAPNDLQVTSLAGVSMHLPAILAISIKSKSSYSTNRRFAYNDHTGYCTNKTTFKYIPADSCAVTIHRTTPTSLRSQYSTFRIYLLIYFLTKSYKEYILISNHYRHRESRT